MNTVRDILWSKAISDVYTIEPRAYVYEAVALFAAHDISALIVVEADEIMGCFSERELARRVTLNHMDPNTTRIYEVMDPEICCVELGTSVEDCMHIMTNEHKRHLAVVQKNRLISVVSIGDIVKARITQQAQLIDQLQSYITS